MRTCNGCGGRVGIDCFNPQECEWIAIQQQYERQTIPQSNHDETIHYLQQHIESLETRVSVLEAITKNLRPL